MVIILIQLVQTVFWLLTLAILASVILSYFLNPYHPVRLFLDRIVQPMLNPIRRVLPTFGGLDFSPLILLLLLQLIERVLINILIVL